MTHKNDNQNQNADQSQTSDNGLPFSDAGLAQERADAVDEVTADLVKEGEDPAQAAADAEQQIEQIEQLIDGLGQGDDDNVSDVDPDSDDDL